MQSAVGGKCYLFGCKVLGLSAVGGLFNRGCPTTVLRFVIAVIVDAVNRMPRGGPLPHIGKECLKRFAPTHAHCNSATSPKMKFALSWVMASFFDASPYFIFTGMGHPMSMWRARSFSFPASTGFRRSSQNIWAQRGKCFTTVAMAEITPGTRVFIDRTREFFDDCKSGEPHAYHCAILT